MMSIASAETDSDRRLLTEPLASTLSNSGHVSRSSAAVTQGYFVLQEKLAQP
jgi:hypothetical protein